MLPDHIIEKYRNDAEGLAKYFSAEYFNTHERTFPINPFHVLTDLGIHFVFRNFKDVEGLFLPAMKDGDVDLVAINAKRPITRQRFTASHELCHYLKDPREGKSFICETGAKKREEYGMSEVCLYSDLFDRWSDMTTDLSTDFAKQVFENSYIYNDARLEGVHSTGTGNYYEIRCGNL